MPLIKNTLLACLIFAIPAYAYVEKVNLSSGISVDFSDPASVVTAAKDLLYKADYQGMLEITEGSEKRKTESTLASIKEDRSLLQSLKSEADKIQKFEIMGKEVYDTQGLAVVYTKWQVKLVVERNSGVTIVEDKDHAVKPFSTVYVDYLLKKIDGKWKIISQKNK